jgi:hypothetical protein
MFIPKTGEFSPWGFRIFIPKTNVFSPYACGMFLSRQDPRDCSIVFKVRGTFFVPAEKSQSPGGIQKIPRGISKSSGGKSKFPRRNSKKPGGRYLSESSRKVRAGRRQRETVSAREARNDNEA